MQTLSRPGGSTQAVCVAFAPWIEPTHIAICVGKAASKTRGEVSKISRKMPRSIAVLLRLFSSIFWTFLMVSAVTDHQQQMAQDLPIQKEPIRETRKDAFYKLFALRFTQTTLSEPFYKSQFCWKSNKEPKLGPIWPTRPRLVKVRAGASTCQVCLCWRHGSSNTDHFCTWLQIWTIERKYNWIRNLKQTNMAACIVREENDPVPIVEF